MAARASVSLHRAQRRDQHLARQHQLDARARSDVRIGPPRRRSAEDSAGHPRRGQRYGDLRQRARVPRHDRPLAPARGAHDDSRAVGRPRNDVARAQGVLRVPRDDDGAVGRPGVDRLHRRQGDRRRARPQRASSVALLRDERRPGHHGVGSRCARRARREHPAQGTAAPGQDFPGRHRAGTHHRGRGDQAAAGVGAALREVARPEHGGARGPQARAAPAAARSLHDGEPAAHVRLHAGGSEDSARADGAQRRRGDRIDGHRHLARGALGQAAPAVRLLHAALRAGDQSAPRCDSRRARHVDGLDDWPGGEPPEAGPRSVPSDQGQVGHRQQRRAGQAAPHRRARVQVDYAADALRRRFRRHGAVARARGFAAPHERSGRAGLHDHHPVRPRREHEARADSEPAGDRRRPSSPRARGHAQSRRARHRDRRGARGASPGAAHRLRRGRREPVSGVRDARRHDSPGHAARADAREGGQELHQGAEQGRAEGDVEDGHLDAAELSRRANLRSGRPGEGFRRPLFHVDGVAHWRRGHRGDRPGSTRAPRAGVPAAPRRRARSRRRRRVPVAPRRRVPSLQSRYGLQAAARDAQRPVQDLQGIHPGGERADAQARDAAWPVRAQGRGHSRFRSRRSSRPPASSSGSPRVRCPTVRSAARRTKRWPSP